MLSRYALTINSLSSIPRHAQHRKAQKLRRRARTSFNNREVRAAERVIIPPESSRLIKVQAHFPVNYDSLFVERCLRHNSNQDDIYGAADTLISREKPVLHVSNFSKRPVIIDNGELLGKSHDPRSWLDKSHQLSPQDRTRAEAHASLIRHLMCTQTFNRSVATVRSESLISSKAQRNATERDDPLASGPLEGGPKTAEVCIDDIPSSKLLSEIHLSPDLTPEQRRKLEEVVIQNANAFGLDGKLGNHDAKVEIQLKPGSQPVSLPPFPVSPANREIM
ncbi:hypothetical protein K435DRAFT_685114, partial [Dendrothele bispora CBS 962.96]